MSIVGRAFRLISNPSDEWDVIADEAASAKGVFFGYAMILAVIPMVVEIPFSIWYGMEALRSKGISSDPEAIGLTPFVAMALIRYLVALLALIAVILIVHLIVSTFDPWTKIVQSTKLMAYATTPAWVAGLISGVPIIGPLLTFIAPIYVIFLIQIGLHPVVGVSGGRGILLTIVIVLIYAALWLLASVVTPMLFTAFITYGISAGLLPSA